MSVSDMPDPFDLNSGWPDARDRLAAEIEPKILQLLGIDPYLYQSVFLNPPAPYRIEELSLVQMGGAKRIGKSYVLAVKPQSLSLMPGSVTRLYGVEHENCKREFNHIERFVQKLARHYPALLEHRTVFHDDPKEGALEMKWAWGAEIVSKSWVRSSQWLGEPIDLGIICEPGIFESGSIYSAKIKPNLEDRRGVVFSAGTVDNPWMFDYHEMAHDHSTHPDIFCVCEIPRWANLSLGYVSADGTLTDFGRAKIQQARDEEGSRDFAINWLGLWENYSDIAFENWAPKRHVKVIPVGVWKQVKKIPAGWDHFLVLDTGRYCAMGQYVVNPKGMILMIDEWTNYRYHSGKIDLTDKRGFKLWFTDIIQSILHDIGPYRNRPIVIIDPSSQFKLDVQSLGLGVIDANNAHDYGVNVANEYLGKKPIPMFYMLRAEGRPRYIAEQEIPRVRWQKTASGVQGKHRLIKGNDDDHSADQFRYGLASRPIAQPYIPEREKTIVEKDIDHISNPFSDKNLDESMGWYYLVPWITFLLTTFASFGGA